MLAVAKILIVDEIHRFSLVLNFKTFHIRNTTDLSSSQLALAILLTTGVNFTHNCFLCAINYFVSRNAKNLRNQEKSQENFKIFRFMLWMKCELYGVIHLKDWRFLQEYYRNFPCPCKKIKDNFGLKIRIEDSQGQVFKQKKTRKFERCLCDGMLH